MILGFLSGEKKTGKQSCKGTYEECYAVCKGEIIMEAAER
jgi:hypothetical protein